MPHLFCAHDFSKPLVFDIFLQNGKLFFISTHYPLFPFNFIKEFQIHCEGTRLTLTEKKLDKDMWWVEGIVPSEDLKKSSLHVSLEFRGEIQRYTVFPDPSPMKKKFLAATLMGIEDLGCLSSYYRYYKAQGLDQFVIYFAGEDLKHVWGFLPQAEDILYACLDCGIDVFRTMIRLRFGPSSALLMVNEVNEFIVHPEKQLSELVSSTDVKGSMKIKKARIKDTEEKESANELELEFEDKERRGKQCFYPAVDEGELTLYKVENEWASLFVLPESPRSVLLCLDSLVL